MRNHLASLFLSFIIASPDPVRIALEGDSAKWFRGVWISGIVVAIGCGLEIWEVAVDLRNWRRHRKKLPVIPDNPGSWLYPMAALGLALVVGGIVGETVFEVLASHSDAAIRSHESDVLSIAEQNSGDANHLAQLAQSGNLQLGIDLANAKGEMANQQERAAKAEKELLEVKKSFMRQSLPRWALVEPLSDFLKNKPTGSVEIVFAPEDDEASRTAMVIELMLGTSKWRVLKTFHPYSENDVVPQYSTPGMKENVFHVTLFTRVGGLTDITLLFSPADTEASIALEPRVGTAAEALWRGMRACGFQALAEEDPRLASGAMRIVVGPKSTLILAPAAPGGNKR